MNNKVFLHFKTITKHRHLVMLHCFRLGMIKQGLMHDLSKYTLTEFIPGCKYYIEGASPHNEARRLFGYSEAWLHHKGRNRHHYEYWIDYDGKGTGHLVGMKMPREYVVEMFVDRVCACKNYLGKKYTDKSALDYYERGKNNYVMDDETKALLEEMLNMMAKKGEAETFSYIKREILSGRRKY